LFFLPELRHEVFRFVRRCLPLRVPVDIGYRRGDNTRSPVLIFFVGCVPFRQCIELRQRQPPEFLLGKPQAVPPET
jgi:hypothetical protein